MEITNEMLQAKKIRVSDRYSYETLEELIKKYGEKATLECEDRGHYGEDDYCVIISYERMETKKEIDNRIDSALRQEERMKQLEERERLKYEELKKKYG